MSLRICALFLGFTILLSSCGDSNSDFVASSVNFQRDVFALEKKAQVEALREAHSERKVSDIVVFDFNTRLAYSENQGVLKTFPSAKPESPLRLQDVQQQAFYRLPTKFGTEARPFQKIQAKVTLPRTSELEWVKNGPGHAGYNYLGIEYSNGLTVDCGLVSGGSKNRVPGHWYVFGAYNAGAYTPASFPEWPEGGIPGGTQVEITLEAIPDTNPTKDGEQPGFKLLIFGTQLPFGHIAVFEGIDQSELSPDGIDTAVRAVSSILWKSEQGDPQMCNVVWSEIMAGTEQDFRLLSPDDINTSPPGKVREEENADILQLVDAHSHVVSFRCQKSLLFMAIDNTASMQDIIDAVKSFLQALIPTSALDGVELWGLVNFDDLSYFRGATEDPNTMVSWIDEIVAFGGGDCQESSLAAINLARLAILEQSSSSSEASRHIIVVTDASPRPYPVEQLTADLIAADIKVHAIVAGDCSPPEGILAQTTQLSSQVVFSALCQETGGQYRYVSSRTPEELDGALNEIFDDVNGSEGGGPGDGEEPPTRTVVLPVAQDSTLTAQRENRNEGSNPLLMLSHRPEIKDKSNNPIVSFNLNGIDLSSLKSARLVLTIKECEIPKRWGDGRFIEAYPVNVEWTEGNGKRLRLPKEERTRGDGPGVTWNSPVDEDISNKKNDGSLDWAGAREAFGLLTAGPVLVTDGQTGIIDFEVTQDVVNGAVGGWVIQKQDEAQFGNVRFYSKEGASLAGVPESAPRLVLEFNALP